jgi:hypothetical protein
MEKTKTDLPHNKGEEKGVSYGLIDLKNDIANIHLNMLIKMAIKYQIQVSNDFKNRYVKQHKFRQIKMLEGAIAKHELKHKICHHQL